MKLSNIKSVGRFKNIETKQKVNIKKGRKKGYGVDVYFYLKSGKRVYVSDSHFYGDNKIWIEII